MALMEHLAISEIDKSESTIASISADYLKNTLRSIFYTSEKLKESVNDLKLKHIFLDEVFQHDSPDDCWIIIYDRVYEVTNFMWSVSANLVCCIICYRRLMITLRH